MIGESPQAIHVIARGDLAPAWSQGREAMTQCAPDVGGTSANQMGIEREIGQRLPSGVRLSRDPDDRPLLKDEKLRPLLAARSGVHAMHRVQ